MMSAQTRRQYLTAMGVTSWERRDRATRATPSLAENAPTNVVAVNADWQPLQQEVATCTKCDLHKTRKNTVFGVGDPAAHWMFIGEAPGADEDAQGEPFVGRAGQLLNAMLFAMGLKRGEVFIANVLKCLRYNALVQLGDGSWERIGRLVRSRYQGDVMSVDANGQLVPRRVTGWHESLLGERRVFRLTYRSAKNAGLGRVSIQLTGDHEVLTQRGFVAVQALRPEDRIATGQGLSPMAFDVACGTLLGDGYISDSRTLLSFSHSDQQRDYAMFKAELLRELEPVVDELLVSAKVGGPKAYAVVQVRTKAHRALRILRRDFYPGKKQIPVWLPNRFNERMLAFWFMDDGYTRIRESRQPLAEIATCAFSERDLSILLESLLRLGLSAKALRGRIHFDVAMTRKLSCLIAPYIPPSMRYKLHPDVAAQIPFSAERFQHEPPTVMYDEIETQDITSEYRADKTFYCIDVEETHNFVTAGGVVHNCRPPGNRDPQPREVECCEPYLLRQIALIQPKLIVALGRHAAHSLLKTEAPLSRLRGQRLAYHGTPLIVTYHPAYLLRSPGEKRKAWSDLCLAKRVMKAAV